MGNDRRENRGSAMATAKFLIGMPVRHRLYGFRGVIFDVDPTFGNTEEWYLSIPEKVRPRKDQPFYHLFAVNPTSLPTSPMYRSRTWSRTGTGLPSVTPVSMPILRAWRMGDSSPQIWVSDCCC